MTSSEAGKVQAVEDLQIGDLEAVVGEEAPMTAIELARLHLDASVGIGNFAYKAMAVSRAPERQTLFLSSPQRLAKGETRGALSVRELVDLSERWATWYRNKGIQPYDVVGVYVEEGFHALVHLCALSSIGAIAAVVNGAMKPEVAERYLSEVGIKGIVCSAAQRAGLSRDFRRDSFCVDVALTSLPAESATDMERFRHSYDDPVLITHTSGSTGSPKAATLAHGQWFHGIRDNIARQAGTPGGVRVHALPTTHNASLAFLIHAVLDGGRVHVVPSMDPDALADRIEEVHPESVSAFPHTFVALATRHAGRRDFSSVRYWISSGDASHEAHIRRLVAEGHSVRGGNRTSGSIYVDGLGSSEMGHISFPAQHTAQSSLYERCIGRPHAWVSARVFDDDGHLCPPGVVGRLGIKSPSVTVGYWNDSALTARSRIDGFFLTGDLVYRDETGRFFHVDRVTDAMKTPSGVCYSLLTEEYLLTLDDRVVDCVVVRGPAKDDGAVMPVAVAWGVDMTGPAAAELLRTFNEGLGGRGMARLGGLYIVHPDFIPRGVTGKVLKGKLSGLLPVDGTTGEEHEWLVDVAFEAPEGAS